jgi:hypothetical protein
MENALRFALLWLPYILTRFGWPSLPQHIHTAPPAWQLSPEEFKHLYSCFGAYPPANCSHSRLYSLHGGQSLLEHACFFHQGKVNPDQVRFAFDEASFYYQRWQGSTDVALRQPLVLGISASTDFPVVASHSLRVVLQRTGKSSLSDGEHWRLAYERSRLQDAIAGSSWASSLVHVSDIRDDAFSISHRHPSACILVFDFYRCIICSWRLYAMCRRA